MSDIAAIAERLFEARRVGAAIPPVRTLLPAKDIAAAYAVQTANNQRREAGGEMRVGRKIGLTSVAVQRQLGVDQPDFGVLFASMDLSRSADAISASRLISPRIEAEISFLLGEGITRKGLSTAELGAAVEAVAASVEIVDSAIADWDIDIVDTVADNASSGAFVIGPWQPFTADMDLRSRKMRITRDGEEISAGDGAATLGDPLNALRWLADTAIDIGDPLRAGEVVLAGALGPMRPMTAGSYVVEIDGFKTLLVRVTA